MLKHILFTNKTLNEVKSYLAFPSTCFACHQPSNASGLRTSRRQLKLWLVESLMRVKTTDINFYSFQRKWPFCYTLTFYTLTFKENDLSKKMKMTPKEKNDLCYPAKIIPLFPFQKKIAQLFRYWTQSKKLKNWHIRLFCAKNRTFLSKKRPENPQNGMAI